MTILIDRILNELIHLVAGVKSKDHSFAAVIWRTLLLAVEPLWFLGGHFEWNDEESRNILRVNLVQVCIKATVVGTWGEKLGLSQGMGHLEEIVQNHVADLCIDVVGDELYFAVKGTDLHMVSLPRSVCSGGVAVNGRTGSVSRRS